MYAPARASSVGLTVRDAFGFHAPHNTLGAAVGRFGPPTPDPGATATEDHTTLYVGIGLGVLAVAGVAIYLATQKKGRRRR